MLFLLCLSKKKYFAKKTNHFLNLKKKDDRKANIDS